MAQLCSGASMQAGYTLSIALLLSLPLKPVQAQSTESSLNPAATSSPPLEIKKENENYRVGGSFAVQNLADKTFETISLSSGIVLYTSQPFSA